MYDIRNMNIWKKGPQAGKKISDNPDTEISELNLSVRSFNCLKRAGYDTVGQIVEMLQEDENGLRRIRNLGSRSEAEILESIERYKEEYARSGGGSPDAGEMKKKVIIKPAKFWFDTKIDSFHLSDKTLASLKQSGVRQVKDLYRADAKQEPGWFAVRELFDKILMELNCT